ncbi:hypothetical protein HGRIS_012740 [Hohenbuehelia grisea]|uniref:Uncharacterized protein n=1 Tax=Hohenbuehelia grisea TaxID=104357 RepID=A0ABR3IT78_9AGAR
MPMVDAGNAIYHHTSSAISPEACSISFQFTIWLALITMTICELILAIRTWAVWYRSRKLAITLPILGLCLWAACVVITAIFINSLKFAVLPPPFSKLPGCFGELPRIRLSVVWAMFMIFEGAMLVLMLVRGFNVYRLGGTSALSDAVYRDGMLFYLYLFVLSFACVVINLQFSVSILICPPLDTPVFIQNSLNILLII